MLDVGNGMGRGDKKRDVIDLLSLEVICKFKMKGNVSFADIAGKALIRIAFIAKAGILLSQKEDEKGGGNFISASAAVKYQENR